MLVSLQHTLQPVFSRGFSITTFLIVLNLQLKMGFFHWKAQRYKIYILTRLFQFISEHLLSTRISGDVIKILRPQQQTRPKCSRPSCSDLSPLPVFSLSLSSSLSHDQCEETSQRHSHSLRASTQRRGRPGGADVDLMLHSNFNQPRP